LQVSNQGIKQKDLEEKMEEEDTIELIDYLKVVWKYRYLIVIGVVFCTVVAAAWSFTLPKVYRASTILEVDTQTRKIFPSVIVANIQAGLEVDIQTRENLPSAIAANIKAGMFDSQVREKIAETSKSSTIPHLSFKVSNPKNSNMIRITCETADIKMGKTILEFLNRVIIRGYQKEVDEVKDLILLKEEVMKNSKTRIDAISNHIKFIDNAIAQREKDKKSMGIDDVSGLILLRSSLRDSLFEQEGLLLDTEESLAGLRSFYEKGGPVKIIQKATSPSTPVKPKMRLNILLAGIVGLFLSVFLAFFIEYIRNASRGGQKVD